MGRPSRISRYVKGLQDSCIGLSTRPSSDRMRDNGFKLKMSRFRYWEEIVDSEDGDDGDALEQ